MLDKARKHTDRLFKVNTRNIGWHGNAILVKRHIGILDCAAIDLPTLEPRGAVMAELLIGDRPLRIVGMHLDLSGLWRKRQMRAILEAVEARPQKMPTVLMGDTNEWRTVAGCLKEFEPDFHIAPTGPTFHAQHPVAALDRIIVHKDLNIEVGTSQMRGVHRTSSSASVNPPSGTERSGMTSTILPFIGTRRRSTGSTATQDERSGGLSRDLPQAAALDRRADAHRLAIFDDRPAGDGRTRAA